MDVTKKIKRNTNKKLLWNLFDQEINKDTTKLECIYSSESCREMCDVCHCSVKLADDGFLICSNEKCGIISLVSHFSYCFI